MKRKLILPSLVLALALLACSTPVNIVVNPTNPPVQAATTQAPPPVGTITVTLPALPPPVDAGNALRNGTYFAPFYGRTVTLVNGVYTVNSAGEIYDVRMLDAVALGDLNGDLLSDAAIVLAENGGGSGVFVSVLALFSSGGSFTQAGAALLGDRVQVNSLSITNGTILLDTIVHGPNDPMCCPSQAAAQGYRMIGGTLWLTRLTTLAGGAPRAIDVTSPADGAEVTNPFTISGSVTISPFENNLVYRIYLPDGTKVNESSLLVDSPGMGTPGAFSQTLNLSMAGITGPVIVQFLDLSAADGSILSLGSVVVNIH